LGKYGKWSRDSSFIDKVSYWRDGLCFCPFTVHMSQASYQNTVG